VVAVGQCARLGLVVVTDADHLDLAHLLERREVSYLRDRSCTYDSESELVGHPTSRAIVPDLSVRPVELRARIIAHQDSEVVLSGPGPTDGAPLAHPHSVAVAATAGFDALDPVALPTDSQGEVVAAQQ